MENNQSVLYGIIGLLLGVVLTGFTASYAVNNQQSGMMRMMGIRGGDTHSMGDDMMHYGADMDDMSMSVMVNELKGLSGDRFDDAFTEMMIAHHQGAIDMAAAAKKSAKHDEIKNMADAIITAQSKEIDEMKVWRTSWGY